MKRKQEIELRTWVFLGLFLAGVAWLACWFAFTEVGQQRWLKLFPRGGGGYAHFEPAADLAFSDDFDRFRSAVEVAAPIVLTIRKTNEEYEILAGAYKRESGIVEFTVKPSSGKPSLFVDPAIERKIRAGIGEMDGEGNPIAKNKVFSGFAIATNSAERTWTVKLSGVRPGIIRLTLPPASKEVKIDLPKLIPLWNASYAFSKQTGDLRLSGLPQPLKALDRCGPDEMGKSMFPPDFRNELCGFRLLCVTQQCAWLEVVYNEPSEILAEQPWWPNATIRWKKLDGGKNKSVVYFGKDKKGKPLEMVEGTVLDFDKRSKRSLRLDQSSSASDSPFKARNAVLFHFEQDGKSAGDVLCLTHVE
jgi:hypothetical protein